MADVVSADYFKTFEFNEFERLVEDLSYGTAQELFGEVRRILARVFEAFLQEGMWCVAIEDDPAGFFWYVKKDTSVFDDYGFPIELRFTPAGIIAAVKDEVDPDEDTRGRMLTMLAEMRAAIDEAEAIIARAADGADPQ